MEGYCIAARYGAWLGRDLIKNHIKNIRYRSQSQQVKKIQKIRAGEVGDSVAAGMFRNRFPKYSVPVQSMSD
jgi:hypothetical protein